MDLFLFITNNHLTTVILLFQNKLNQLQKTF